MTTETPRTEHAKTCSFTYLDGPCNCGLFKEVSIEDRLVAAKLLNKKLSVLVDELERTLTLREAKLRECVGALTTMLEMLDDNEHGMSRLRSFQRTVRALLARLKESKTP